MNNIPLQNNIIKIVFFIKHGLLFTLLSNNFALLCFILHIKSYLVGQLTKTNTTKMPLKYLKP